MGYHADNYIRESNVYLVPDIMKALGISRNTAYSFIKDVYEKKEPFPVLKIKTTYRIPKEPFDNWINGRC